VIRGHALPGRALRLAHRGDHRHEPENTIAAFGAALAVSGCDGFEFDVRLSSDGVPVVIHDESLGRVQGRPDLVAALTADQLAVEGVPTLMAVLAVAGSGSFLDVELKVDAGPAVVEVLRAGRGPMFVGTVVSSFEPGTLASIRGLEPTWPCWLNADALDDETLARAVALGCAGVSVEWHGIDAERVARARAAGLDVAAWTVTDPADALRVEAAGVVAICVEGAALVE
jgi:glycerophosphoryl diester phosphodiesterase